MYREYFQLAVLSCYIFIFLLLNLDSAQSQPIDVKLTPYQTLALKLNDRQSFWGYSNEGGKISPYYNQSITGLKLDLKHAFSDYFEFKAYSDVFLSTHYGLVAQDYGAEIKVPKWFKLGWGTENPDIGLLYHPLSTGSFVYSGNAKPFEKIYFATDGFVPLYILGKYSEYFLINGYISHTTFKSRAVYNERLHHKFLYGHALKPLPFSIYGGLSHMAFWAGETEEFGTLAGDWDTFKKLFWAIGGGDQGPESETAYTLGNHIGIFDFGALLNLETFSFDLYRTFLVEDRDGLNFKNLWEGVFGGVLTLKKNKWINAINYEYIYTKRQSGDTPPPIDNSRGGPGGWDNYYNHFLYTDGWTSDGFTVGNPLFSSRSSTGLGINLAVSNNRIVAHHIGVDYTITGLLSAKTFLTYTRNYGTYNERFWASENNIDYIFKNGPRQWYFGTWFVKNIEYYYPFEVRLGIFAEFGDLLGTQFSSQLSVKTTIQPFLKSR